MATDTERLVIELSANLKNFENNWRRANGLIAKNTKLMEKSFGGAERAAQRAASAIVAAFGVREIANLTDQYTRFTNQLKIAGFEGARLAATQEDIFGIAQKYGVALEDLGTLFGRTSQSANELGASQADLRKFVEGTAAAMRVQGGDVSTARGALIQLSQALGGTTVRAEEFNSMQEGLRPLVIAAANGIDRMGGSFARLRSEVIAGKVSSREFFEGLLKGYDKTIEQARTAELTISQSFTTLNNALGKYLGETNANVGATHRLAEAINLLAENIDTVASALAILSLALGVGFVRNALLATGAARAFGASLNAAVGGPIGLAITAVVVGLTYVAQKATDASLKARALEGAHKKLDPILNTVKESLDRAAESTGALRDGYLAAADAATALGQADLISAQKSVAAAQARVRALEASGLADRGDPETGVAYAGMIAETRLRRALAELQAQQELLVDAGLGVMRGSRGMGTRFIPNSAATQLANREAARDTIPPAGEDKDKKGKTAAEIASMRELLRLEHDLALAEATGDKAQVEALERLLSLRQLERQFADAGYVDAAARAEAAQQELDYVQAMVAAETAMTAQAQKTTDALKEQAEAAQDVADAIAEKTIEAAKAGVDAAKDEAEARKEALMKAKDFADDLREKQYDATYNGISDALTALADGNALEYLGKRLKQMALDNLARGITDALMNQGGGGGGIFQAVASFFGGSKVPAYATGTNYHPGGMAMVGERGPELLSLPRGSKVTPNGKMGGMGTTVVINLNNPVVWEGEVAKLRAYVNQVGAMAAATGARQGEASAIARMTKAAHQRLPGR